MGIFIDSGLKFHQHTDLIANKASRLVGLIRWSFRHLDTKTFTRLYKALVQPTIEFGNIVWVPSYIGNVIKIEKVRDMPPNNSLA